ncbi:hypothetical protein NDU88_005302 [Pleurodeles waltl]|uniref:Uncharacterized protein n=1 Tax=Pleurodeles waltl TaxID=8319 RepID=A0AAV7NM44_PLEWA|nr:hypothetical protein NDU88_005302 [Pleurodeles waltl]
MGQYAAQSSDASLKKDHSAPLEKGAEPNGAQILAAMESSQHAMQTQNAAISVDVKLLRVDLRVVTERSVATEKQVMCLQSDMDTLKTSVTILEAKTQKLEARVEDTEGRGASTYLVAHAPIRGIVLHLDRFLLADDGSLDVRRVVYQVRFLLGYAPLLLECEMHMPKPAIPLWHLHPVLLGDLEYKKDLQGVLDGYLLINWGTAATQGLEWEALKVVIRGESLSKTYGIRQRLDRQLTQQEEVLAAIQRQVDSGNALEVDCLEVRDRIVDL